MQHPERWDGPVLSTQDGSGSEDIGEFSRSLTHLRPVRFRYKSEVVGEGNRPWEFGLLAEEVANAFPELVIYDEAGEPFAVRYHLLTPLLLNELQEEQRLNQKQEAEIRRLTARLERLEGPG